MNNFDASSMILAKDKINIEGQSRCNAFFPRIRRVREKTHLLEPLWREAKRKQMSFRVFWTLEKKSTSRTVQTFNFSYLKKVYFRVRCSIFFIHSGSNLCSNGLNFPAKRLGKNTALTNTHAPYFLRMFFKVNVLFHEFATTKSKDLYNFLNSPLCRYLIRKYF